MWVWWIVSLVILIACIIFSLYIFFATYKTIQVEKGTSPENSLDIPRHLYPVTKQQIINSLKLKLQSVEHSSSLYYTELKQLQERIQALEKNNTPAGNKEKFDKDENWEELYYQIHDEKEKMESELDVTNQKLAEAESYLNELKERERSWKEKRSELEMQLNKAHSLQNKIGELQRELEGSLNRETDLQQQLLSQKELLKDFELLQQQYAQLQSESDELRNRMLELNNRDLLLQEKNKRLTELESAIEISEYEKMDIKKSVEEIITENDALVTKLQELQEKLNAEKYA